MSWFSPLRPVPAEHEAEAWWLVAVEAEARSGADLEAEAEAGAEPKIHFHNPGELDITDSHVAVKIDYSQS